MSNREWYASAETYSGADRCFTCAGRACLSEHGAERLVHASGGRLQAFRCRDGRGWHVWSPTIEAREFAGR